MSGGNWWRANDISIGHLTREIEVGDRWRDKTCRSAAQFMPRWTTNSIRSAMWPRGKSTSRDAMLPGRVASPCGVDHRSRADASPHVQPRIARHTDALNHRRIGGARAARSMNRVDANAAGADHRRYRFILQNYPFGWRHSRVRGGNLQTLSVGLCAAQGCSAPENLGRQACGEYGEETKMTPQRSGSFPTAVFFALALVRRAG